MTAPIPGVGPQLDRAAAGTDPRGILTFESLPDDLRRAEDSTQANDRCNPRYYRGFQRPATPAERTLLQHLGFENLPGELTTHVKWVTPGCRRRTWPELENQEAS